MGISLTGEELFYRPGFTNTESRDSVRSNHASPEKESRATKQKQVNSSETAKDTTDRSARPARSERAELSQRTMLDWMTKQTNNQTTATESQETDNYEAHDEDIFDDRGRVTTYRCLLLVVQKIRRRRRPTPGCVAGKTASLCGSEAAGPRTTSSPAILMVRPTARPVWFRTSFTPMDLRYSASTKVRQS